MTEHRHSWKPGESVVGVGPLGFSEGWHRRFEAIAGFRLAHPGYILGECRCGAKALRDYCTNAFPRPEPWHVISDETHRRLSA